MLTQIIVNQFNTTRAQKKMGDGKLLTNNKTLKHLED